MDGAHLVLLNGCGRFGQSDRFLCEGRRERGDLVNDSRWNCRLNCLLGLSPVRRIGGGVNFGALVGRVVRLFAT